MICLKKKNVHLYWTENEEKSSVVERWNRTIKSKMWKYFTKNRTGVYVDILPTIIEAYNNTYHRSIKCSPSDARKPANYQHVFNALYNDVDSSTNVLRPRPKFKIGDQVRISKLKKKFEKGYTENWTNETVSQFGKTNLMIKKDHLKYQDYGVNGQEVLFDLHRDPSENQNFIDDPDYMESVSWFRQRLSQLGHGPNADPDYVNAGYARDV